MGGATAGPAPLSSAQLDAVFERVKTWGRWGDQDEMGMLHHLTPERTAAAAAAVRGTVVSLARDLAVTPTAEVPVPALHHMLASGDARGADGIPGYEASRDFIGTDVHGLGITHVDAFSHMFVNGLMYNGFPAELVTSRGARRNSVMTAGDGVVGRGVLLDIPRVRGVEFLEGSDVVTIADLEAAEEAEKVRLGAGDILVVSTGRDARAAAAPGPLSPIEDGLAGLHPECLEWLHQRCPSVLAGDGISDRLPPGGAERWPFPVHQIGITAMGLHLVDSMRLDRLTSACAAVEKWSFLLTVAPLRIPGGTGCPVNPIALL